MASSEIPSMTSAEAWTFLREQPDSQLVDVRTHEEHYFVGAPDLSPLGKDAFLNPVKTFDIKSRKWANEPAFVSHIKARFPDPNTPIFFICRSGLWLFFHFIFPCYSSPNHQTIKPSND
eukprot:TRINITY_DN6702_c0_g1_i1.p1 TRINITY_DN6702_c0_g1~~TRINITY_DN6702_c0_g1_i1.p1  ORF type:complete len:119 (+),score=27.35 TRINITY_DN6702_c0_g1_i1:72-428(+)